MNSEGMALDNGLDDKSRKERRKEARLAKNKKKLDSWVQRQQIGKLRKASMDSEAKDVKKSQHNSQIPRNRDADHSSEVHNVVENHEDELDSNTLPDFDKPKAVKRKKSLMRSEKSKFEEYLEMETHRRVLSAEEDMRLEKKLAKKLKLKDEKLRGDDDDLNVLLDGIPSIMGSLDVGKTPYAEEDGKIKRISRKKHKKSKLTEEEPESKIEDDAMTEKNDGLEQPVLLKASNIKSKPSKNPDSTASNTVKRKKTKFEQYIEMEMKGGLLFGEEDVALERKLAKKLKVKEGKLRGDDDDINMLFEGIPSTIESLEGEQNISAEEDPVEDLEHSPPLNKQKKKSSLKHKQVAELETKEAPTKVPVVEAKAKYLAPHLRSYAGKETEEHSQVRRRVRGLLNRLSESNVESITGELSTIVQSVGRSTASQIIGEEILASCSGGPRGNEQYAAVFAASVAGMSCLVGIDFGAKLLASLAKAFEAEYMKEDNLSLRNLTLLLSYLYIFGVCSSELIYDFIIMLSKRLMEVDVSTILTLLQCCGMKLRSDDPVAMKNFILSVQNRVNELKATLETGEAKTSGKRMEFMLETILDIKNNKKRPKADTVQHTRIRKWLQKLRVDDILIRGLKWSKLCDPDKKGQWWLSGDNAAATDNIEEVAGTIDRELNDAQKMLQLAAAQRMNTDARRAIFCVIMSSDDYIDAFEKLLRLDLAGKQDREIMRVLVDCCLQEKVFNKYYCVLASKLCSHDKNHKFTLQYCLWDHYKELESMQLLRSMHLSKFVAEMLSSYSLSLAVLKVVDLADITQLTPKRAMHFRMLFEAIFNYSDKLVWNIFTRIAVIPEYEGLRSGIVFFVSKYVLNSQKSLADKFKVAKKALNNAEGVIL